MIEKVITPRQVIDALSSAAVITPLLVELNKSNTERRTRICASTLENLRRNILSLDESSSPTIKIPSAMSFGDFWLFAKILN
jgi:hypothetical protein